MFIFLDEPARALPIAKKAIDINITGFRPKTSARAPDKGKIAVLEREYADPTQT